MKKILITVCAGVVFATSGAIASEFYQGLTDGSDGSLKKVCQSYLLEGFSKNKPELYLKYLPPSAKSMETSIYSGFDSLYKKRFGAGSNKINNLEIQAPVSKTYKGKQTKRFRLTYNVEGNDRVVRSSCYFKLHEDGKWYFGEHPG